MTGKNGLKLFLTPLTGIAALIFFLYRAVAGAFFGTTSLTLEAEKTNDEKVIIKATIERGDNWLVEIKEAQYKILFADHASEWIKFEFLPPDAKSRLRLAPKEKTQCQIKKDAIPAGTRIIGRVLSFPVSYPLLSRSYAQTIVVSGRGAENNAAVGTISDGKIKDHPIPELVTAFTAAMKSTLNDQQLKQVFREFVRRNPSLVKEDALAGSGKSHETFVESEMQCGN